MKLRYSLSHILLVVTIVALICGWVIDHLRLEQKRIQQVSSVAGIAREAVDNAITYTLREIELMHKIDTAEKDKDSKYWLSALTDGRDGEKKRMQQQLDDMSALGQNLDYVSESPNVPR